MAWKRLYPKAKTSNNHASMITVQKGGTIRLNLEAHEALESPEFVEVLFDEDKKLLGLKRSKTNETAFPVRRIKEQNAWVISARGALKMANIGTDKAFRRPASIEKGIVFIDVTELFQGLPHEDAG